MHGRETIANQNIPEYGKESDSIQRHRYVTRCRQAIWKRREREHLTALWKNRNMMSETNEAKTNVRNLITVRREEN